VTAFESLAGRVDAIVIGASAGGVEALSVILPALPARIGAAVFVVLHLPRERPSLLPAIFGEKCAVSVREAEDKELVEPGTLYFAPPDYHLLIDRGPSIALSADAPVHYSRPSIDVLFESAADQYRERLLGIILTGANQDGASGLAAIDRSGGLTLVQHPESAQAPLMIQSAMSRTRSALALSLEQIAGLFRTLDSRDDQ
jgi:two-component system, chemotaxis family, protein-glutamate methylesterase/glutaminase